jgi:hypothetical protein
MEKRGTEAGRESASSSARTMDENEMVIKAQNLRIQVLERNISRL